MRIVIPLFDGFTALDAVGPYEVLRMLPGADVIFAAAAPGPVRDGAGFLTRTAAAAFQLAIEYDPQPPFDAGSYAKAPQAAKDLLTSRAR
jgi:putative intracellular protease/amidase